jgi:Mg2+ and Co2+ transporter CorA
MAQKNKNVHSKVGGTGTKTYSQALLPASLIAGIFGMNVKGLPLTDNGNGFLWSIALLIGASALVFWLLKRSGILEG